MNTAAQLGSSDEFFYYGSNDIAFEIEADLLAVCVQPKRSLFYSRTIGAGVSESENYANGISLSIGLRFDIVNSIAILNERVSDGSDGDRDRRVAASQNTVTIEQNGEEMDILVQYIPLADAKAVSNISIPIGSTKHG